MISSKKDLPAVRACIFDMDGLLINSEDVITVSINQLLQRHGRPTLTPSIRAKLMGVPNSTFSNLFHDAAQLPISREQWSRELLEQAQRQFQNCEPLPGAMELLSNLSRASNTSGDRIQLALASSTRSDTYKMKSSRPDTKRLLGFFQSGQRILGDDPRVQPGRGKPAPDIYLLALEVLNSALGSGTRAIQPSECLVFEDSVAGVEAARRAGMRVVWVPHADVAVLYQARYGDVLAGRSGDFAVDGDWKASEFDGWAESLPSLEHFNYKQYGIAVPI